jgi:hypothetical protein
MVQVKPTTERGVAHNHGRGRRQTARGFDDIKITQARPAVLAFRRINDQSARFLDVDVTSEPPPSRTRE